MTEQGQCKFEHKKIDFKTLSYDCYNTAKSKGFFTTYVGQTHYQFGIVSEYVEAMKAYSSQNWSRLSLHEINYLTNCKDDTLFKYLFEAIVKDTIEDEIADICMRTMSYYVHRGAKEDVCRVKRTSQPIAVQFDKALWNILKTSQYEPCFLLDSVYAIERLCFQYRICLYQHILLKLRYNSLRNYLHKK